MKFYRKSVIALLFAALCTTAVYADSAADIRIADDGMCVILSGAVDMHDFGFSDGQIKTNRAPYYPLQIAVVISDPSTGEKLFTDQVKADASGSYSTKFILSAEYGDYNAELYTAYGKIYEGSVYYTDGIVSNINELAQSSDTQGLKDYIVSYNKYIGLDLSLYSQFTEEEQQTVIENVAKSAPYVKKGDVKSAFSDASFNAGLGNETLSAEAKSQMFNEYMDNLGDEYAAMAEFIKDNSLGSYIISLFNTGEYSSVKDDIKILSLKSYLSCCVENIYDLELLFTDENLFSIPDTVLKKYKAVTDYSAFYTSLNKVKDQIDTLEDFYDKTEKSIPAKADYSSGRVTGGGGGGSRGTSITGPSAAVEIPKVQAPDNTGVDPADKLFSDLSSYDWAKTAIYELSKTGAVSGSGNGTFLPSNSITREEFAKIAALSFGITPKEGSAGAFSDVNEGDWFNEPVSAMASNDIIKGISDTEFGVGRPITRQDAATVLSRILGLGASEAPETFADDAEIAAYAKDGVYALKAGNMIAGYEDNTFRPEGLLTRAEAAQMIYNILKLGKGGANIE